MGKGGQQSNVLNGNNSNVFTVKKSTQESSNNSSTIWKSEYNPTLDVVTKRVLPTKGQIRSVIPAKCFERSYMKSCMYLLRDTITAIAFVYVSSKYYLSTTIPVSTLDEVMTSDGSIQMLQWIGSWMFYGFWMGTIMTGPWVLAHECGHGAFSPNQTFNDIVGFIVHQFLLVPYFAWQYTHAKHHKRTNHLQDGESHVPSTASENGLDPNTLERHSLYAVLHEVLGDTPFALFQIWSHLFIGWPIYLLGFASTGKWKYDGTPLNGSIADHFRPNSPMFTPKVRAKIYLSTITEIASLVGLYYIGTQYGHLNVFLWYWNPYVIVNAWLVLYTWLQHTDPSVPHYGEGEWTWVRGALSTIDRPYGIFDYFHHTIGSTHVVHHLFHEMPWYNAGIATKHVKEYLQPMGLYNYDPTHWIVAMWRIANTCHYVDTDTGGIQYFHSFNNVPKSYEFKLQQQELKNKKA